MSALPEGWKRSKIGAIATPRMGKTILAKHLTTYGIPVYSAGRANEPWGFVSESELLFDEKTVVLSARGSIGFPKIPRHSPFISTQTTIAVQAPTVDIARWMKYWLETVDWGQATSGAAIPMITVRQVEDIEIPVAPLTEQKRIITQLDNLFARIEACHNHLARVPGILKRFRQSILAAATSGDLTREWREAQGLTPPVTTTLGEVLRVSSGKFLPAKDMAPAGTIPVFGGNGINGYHDKANVEQETLVIGRVGFYCGSVYLTPPRAWVTDNALIVHHDSSRTLSHFLYYALQAVNLRANDSSTAQPVISGAKIYPTSIAIPDAREQIEIVRRLDALLELTESIEERRATVALNVSRILSSLLAKAFRGELVTQDPNDEPASELLARLGKNNHDSAVDSDKPKRGSKRGSGTTGRADTNMLTRKDVMPDHLSTILKERGALAAEALWSASRLEIDEFYDQLKDEEARGLLRENNSGAPNGPRLLEPTK